MVLSMLFVYCGGKILEILVVKIIYVILICRSFCASNKGLDYCIGYSLYFSQLYALEIVGEQLLFFSFPKGGSFRY